MVHFSVVLSSFMSVILSVNNREGYDKSPFSMYVSVFSFGNDESVFTFPLYCDLTVYEGSDKGR